MKMLVLAVALVIALGAVHAQPFAPEVGRWKTLAHGPTFDWPSVPGAEPATGPVTSDEVFSLFQDIDGSRWPDEPGITSPFRFALLSRGKVYLLATFRGRSEAGFLEAPTASRTGASRPRLMRCGPKHRLGGCRWRWCRGGNRKRVH